MPNFNTSYTITINPLTEQTTQFECNETMTILEAALNAGVILPYSCKNGACNTCQSPLISGHVVHQYDNVAVNNALNQGAILPCCAKPTSDVSINARLSTVSAEYPIRKIPARIVSIKQVNGDVAIVHLQLPAADPLKFKAGQYLEFILKEGARRAYSIANAPHSLQNNNNQVELHIRHLQGGLLTDALFSPLLNNTGNVVLNSPLKPIQEKDLMRIEVPLGTFFWQNETEHSTIKPIIMVASGTGFAPIKAMIEERLFQNNTHPIVLYWGGRTLNDLYKNDLVEFWAKNHPHITYIPVLSEPESGTPWAGRTGFVHHAVMQDYPDLQGHHVYACGAPIMVNSAKNDFINQCGLDKHAFFADSFISKADSN